MLIPIQHYIRSLVAKGLLVSLKNYVKTLIN